MNWGLVYNVACTQNRAWNHRLSCKGCDLKKNTNLTGNCGHFVQNILETLEIQMCEAVNCSQIKYWTSCTHLPSYHTFIIDPPHHELRCQHVFEEYRNHFTNITNFPFFTVYTSNRLWPKYFLGHKFVHLAAKLFLLLNEKTIIGKWPAIFSVF